MSKVLSGFTSCPYCHVNGSAQEPYQALPTDDGRVLCFGCQRITTQIRNQTLVPTLQSLPEDVIEIVLSLISVPGDCDLPTYELLTIGERGLGFSHPMTEQDHKRAALAAAQGNTDVLLSEAQRIDISFRFGPHALHTVRISYLPEDLRASREACETNGAEDQNSQILGRLSQPEAFAFSRLLEHGFKPFAQGVDLESAMRRLPMTKGTQGKKGIRAEISWVA